MISKILSGEKPATAPVTVHHMTPVCQTTPRGHSPACLLSQEWDLSPPTGTSPAVSTACMVPIRNERELAVDSHKAAAPPEPMAAPFQPLPRGRWNLMFVSIAFRCCSITSQFGYCTALAGAAGAAQPCCSPTPARTGSSLLPGLPLLPTAPRKFPSTATCMTRIIKVFSL